jgi:hypothetical protein
MTTHLAWTSLATCLGTAIFSLSPARADEGMWLFNAPPREALQAKYGFDVTDAWLDHLMKSSVRFNNGGSGSFVSADGLVITNHHVGVDALQKLSTREGNLLRDGFQARRREEELRCVDLELNVLQSIEDVTDRVNAAVPKDAGPDDAVKARRKVTAEIEQESQDRTGLRSDVVTLFQGARYHLYRFKRYTDVRVVFAPEQQIAFFGGDPDNFEYPRYNLDISLFRVYEHDRPAKIPHHLTWSTGGARPGELTFVPGHPGRTSRLLTMAELAHVRDVRYPQILELLKRQEVLLTAYGARSEENARRAKDELLGIQNSRKALDGGLAGLLDPVLMGRKAKEEAALRQAAAASAEFANVARAYEEIAAAQQEIGRMALRFGLLEGAQGFNSDLFGLARILLRAGEERPKPNGERLPEFRESSRESLELELFSTKPIHADFEILKLADSLTFLAEKLGAADTLVQTVLAGKSPRARAAELVNGTTVRDVAVRRRLYEGGAAAVTAAGDPMIQVAQAIDAEARQLRKSVEAQGERKQQAHALLARARFAQQGANSYPDATFTLRLAYGVIQGYEENGQPIPPFTTYAGLYERAVEMNHRPPFDLPERWLNRREALDLTTPFNFVGTHDIIGGNSGSPVVNRAGEFVGIIFDGNLPSLVLDFAYDDVSARSLSVHSAGIIEALRKVYQADGLVDELVGRTRP